MKDFLFFLDPPNKDETFERISKEAISNKYWNLLGISMIALLMTMLIAGYTMFKLSEPSVPITFSIKKINNTYTQPEQLITLPYPHQSYKNVSGWIVDAMQTIYTLSFDKFYDQVEQAEYYFTPDGYKTYINALKSNKLEEEIISKQLEIAIVPMQDPAYIGGGKFGDTEWWRYRVPSLASYYGGKEPVIQKYMIEILVIRVPSYQNHKGLAIAEFNMIPI